MEIRFYLDDLGEPHMRRHRVTEQEVEEALRGSLEDRGGTEGTRVATGQTVAGRFIRVVYVPEPSRDSVFVITAYDLGPKALKALRRRLRGRR